MWNHSQEPKLSDRTLQEFYILPRKIQINVIKNLDLPIILRKGVRSSRCTPHPTLYHINVYLLLFEPLQLTFLEVRFQGLRIHKWKNVMHEEMKVLKKNNTKEIV